MELAKTGTPVQQFYAGKTVFLTGGTGFMGSLLLEKLLRSCPEVRRVYVLIRKGRSESVQQRLQEFFLTPVFTRVRKEFPWVFKKITPIEGELTLPNLGISKTDAKTLITDVQIVLHLAASTKFTDPLSTAVGIILRGTLTVLELARRMINLQVFIHTSTIICVYNQTCVEEKIYPKPPNRVSWRELLAEPDLNSKENAITENEANTYMFVKAHTEVMLAEMRGDVPVGIVRPGAVMCTAYEPEPSWTPNTNSLERFLTDMGLGCVRFLPMNPANTPIIVPADMSVNALLVCAWRTAALYSATRQVLLNNTLQDIPIFNHCTRKEDMTISHMMDSLIAKFHADDDVCNNGLKQMVVLEDRQPQYEILNLLLNIAPLTTQELQTDSLQNRRRIRILIDRTQKLIGILMWCTFRDWNIVLPNMNATWHLLTPEDKEQFKFYIPELNLDEYFEHLYRSIRRNMEHIQNRMNASISNASKL